MSVQIYGQSQRQNPHIVDRTEQTVDTRSNVDGPTNGHTDGLTGRWKRMYIIVHKLAKSV